MVPSARPVLLRPVHGDDLPGALAAALAGGPPVAPLPAEPGERARALDALRLDEPVSEPDAAAVVLTSGSTGRPKGVVLSRSAVRASVAATQDRLGGPGDWVLALPAHHVAGLMVLARAHLGGGAVRSVRPDLADLAGATATRPRRGRRYLSLVPTQLARALGEPATAAALTGFSAVLVGGGPCPPDLLDRARARDVPVVTTYGMSETCGGCVYDGRPLDDVSVSLDLDERVVVGGPVVFSGYRLLPDLTADVLVDGRFQTADRGRWETDAHGSRRLRLLGRTDDVVVSGGLNVDLAEVERRAQAWPDLGPRGELVVVGVPHPEWGTEVVAVTDRPLSLRSLRQHLNDGLPAYAAPRRLVALDSLPRTGSGKIDRQRIRALLAASGFPGHQEELA